MYITCPLSELIFLRKYIDIYTHSIFIIFKSMEKKYTYICSIAQNIRILCSREILKPR